MTTRNIVPSFAALALVLTPTVGRAQAKVRVSDGPAATAPQPATTTTTAIPGAVYAAGPMRRWFLGNSYRDLWTASIRIPVLDLGTYAGGLKPLKAGGGMQTKSLRLIATDGNEYVFRLVKKDHAWTVPEGFKGSVVERVSRDQVSTGHPAGAVVVAPLLEAAGVLHATPMLVVMPADAALGEFTADFAGQLGIIEAYPHTPETGPGFAGALQIIDSEDLLKKINADATEHVDANAFLAARLMDMLVGDWDRHTGQWKWARMPNSQRGTWVPIARDRDMAFVTYEGVLGAVGHRLSPVSARFSGTSTNVSALTWNSVELDRRLLGAIDKATWDSVAADVTRRITDDRIDAAVGGLPVEYLASAPRLAVALKERRTRLPATAAAFYKLVFDVADIHGGDAAENATVTRRDDGFVDVRVQSAKGEPVFSRRFDASETQEIRLYLHGGDDSAVVLGTVNRSIPVRIIGGNGTNQLTDSGVVNGKRNQSHFYDRGTETRTNYGKDTLFNRQHWEFKYHSLEAPGRDRGHAMQVGGGVSSDRGFGITPRLRVTRYEYGFESRPYRSRLDVEGSYAFDLHDFRIVASADQRRESSPLHFTEVARVSGLELINYYGIGNATADSGAGSRYNRVRQRQFLFRPAVAIALGSRSDLSLGPVVQYASTDSAAGRFVSSDRPYGFGSFGQAGMRINLHHDGQDKESAPARRFIVDINGTVFPALWDVKSAYAALSLAFEGSVTLAVPTRPMLVFRTGGKKLYGEFPFQDAAFIGGNHTMRYMEGQRYAGDAAVFASTELRVPVMSVTAGLPLDVGPVGLAEAGRVFAGGASPGGWHRVFGGGLWFSLRGDRMRAITVTMVSEDGHRGVHVRTGLGF